MLEPVGQPPAVTTLPGMLDPDALSDQLTKDFARLDT